MQIRHEPRFDGISMSLNCDCHYIRAVFKGEKHFYCADTRACERSGNRGGAGRKPTGAERSGERGSKNQAKREREVVGTGTER